MKILLSLSNYSSLTGSELYVYELARELYKQNHQVTILANRIGGPIMEHHNREAIPVYAFFDHPDLQPDVVINSQPLPTNYCLSRFPQAIHMQVLHSLFTYEQPVIHIRLKKYIAVRPEIKKRWEEKYPFLKEKITVIWNGVDTKRFTPSSINKSKEAKEADRDPFVRLFVGTYDNLRTKAVLDLLKMAQKENSEPRVRGESQVWLVTDIDPFKPGQRPEFCTVFPPTWDIEKYVVQCDETAGIFIGRTTIEGFMMGKPALIYDVDQNGNIIRKYGMTVPKNTEVFDSHYMTKKVLEVANKP